MMAQFVVVAVLVLVWAAMSAMFASMAWTEWRDRDGDWLMVGFPAVLFVVVAIGIPAFVVAASQDGPDRGLCLAGHQEWRTSHSAMLVGKVVVPTTSSSRVWVCERWERP